MNSRMTRGAQFCENVVQAVFAESEKFGVSPSNIMQSLVDCSKRQTGLIVTT